MKGTAKEGIRVDQVVHIGFVVRDLDRVVAYWSSMFGIGPWTFITEADRKIASAFVGPVQFEVFQPLAAAKTEPGTTIELLTKFLNTWGDGIHHIGFAVDDVKEATSKLEAQGVKSLVKNPKGLMSYVEGSPNGAIFEIVSNIFYEEVRKTGIGDDSRARVDKRLRDKYRV